MSVKRKTNCIICDKDFKLDSQRKISYKWIGISVPTPYCQSCEGLMGAQNIHYHVFCEGCNYPYPNDEARLSTNSETCFFAEFSGIYIDRCEMHEAKNH